MPVKPPKCVTLNRKQMKALKERIKARSLAEEDYDVLQGLAAEAVEILGDALKEKDTSLGRLCKYVFGAPTETAKNILKKAQAVEKPKPEKKPGHGRKPASEYTGGEKVVVRHPSLNLGDHCPGCEKRDALIEYAAQGHLIQNDDTTMKVLEFLKETESCYLRLKMDPPERFFGPTRKLPVSGFSQSIFRFRTPQAKN